MPLDLNQLIDDEFEEITFNDKKFKVPSYLPSNAAPLVISMNDYIDIGTIVDVNVIDKSIAKRSAQLFELEKKIVVEILTAKRKNKPLNNKGEVKKFVRSLNSNSFLTVWKFIFAYFEECAAKKKAV